MVDFFQLLDEPRQPWLDPNALKQKFLARSAAAHPDRFHTAPAAEREATGHRYTELNAAWQCLREPKDRLRHLLELERGAAPADIQRVPPELTDRFFAVGRLCRETTIFLEEKARTISPLMRAQLFPRGAEWADQLLALQQPINRSREDLLAELKAMNPAWTAAATRDPAQKQPLLARLEEIYRLLGYLGRWSEQLQERIVQLTF
jgi:hypothetical protein